MQPGILEAEGRAAHRPGVARENMIRAQVHSLLSSLYPTEVPAERRSDHRYPFARLIVLRVIGDDGISPTDETCIVVGKDISDHGLGFYHPDPLPHRRLIASIQLESDRSLDFMIEVNWCRFTRFGWYESGGRFLSIAEGTPPGGPAESA